MLNAHKANQDHYSTSATVSMESLPDSLPEVVESTLAPLFELFDFFRLPKRLVEGELRDLTRNTFAM